MRLYQRESYRTKFESEVLAVRPEGWVRLQDTLFYPTSGGQPHDTGHLGDARVVAVELNAGEVWQQLQGRVPEVGQTVTGELDWPRRYHHMQRHSAQHLLSQVFVRSHPAFETRSVSLSGPVCTLDLAGEPQQSDVARAEEEVNRVAYATLPVSSFEIDERELGNFPLRRPPKVSGRIRLVQMGDFELSACGGTHLKSTAEALPIKLLRLERVKGGLERVHFVAGWEALGDYGFKHQLVSELARGFSAHATDVSARVSGLQRALAEREAALNATKLRLVERLAAELLAQHGVSAEGGTVSQLLNDDEADLLEPLAQTLATRSGVTALLAAPQGERVRLLFARHPGLATDLRAALEAALPHVQGRGGGSAGRVQGSGNTPTGAQAALEAAAQYVQLHSQASP